ncbi:MAG: YebC/PmpR family DNA-binding transcriptional regulator [Peptococcaceae bacterium]|nr:YebC/PmpR family DNA-binding transcriptional regulator [Peptococcaceae bacterium]
MADYTDWLTKCAFHLPNKSDLNLYQGIGPGGCALLLYGLGANEEKLADIFAAYGGKYGQQVSWLFGEKGQVLISKYQSNCDENTLMLEGLGAGAEDVRFNDGDLVELITKKNKLQDVVDILKIEEIPILRSSVIVWPQQQVVIQEAEQVHQLLQLLDEVLALPEIANFVSDFWISDEQISQMV